MPNVKEIVKVIDSRITAQELTVGAYQKLIDAGNLTHVGTYRARQERANYLIEELRGLREFIQPTVKEETNGRPVKETTEGSTGDSPAA